MDKEKKNNEIFFDFEENFDDTYFFSRDCGALFLDRDGVIINDVHYISNPDEVEL